MIDNFSLLLTHGLLLLVAWRLLSRPDLNREDAPPRDETPRPAFGKQTRKADAPDA